MGICGSSRVARCIVVTISYVYFGLTKLYHEFHLNNFRIFVEIEKFDTI